MYKNPLLRHFSLIKEGGNTLKFINFQILEKFVFSKIQIEI